MSGNLDRVAAAVQSIIPMSFPLGRAWYVAVVRAQSEFDAEKDIQALGFDAYVPRCRRHRAIAHRKVITEWPLISGYVFVSFDIEKEDWQKILAVDDISEILSNNSIPVRVKSSDLDRLRRSEKAGAFDFTIPATTFKAGGRYRIAEGPFANFIARFRAATSKKRAKIVIEFFGGLVDTEIDTCILEQIS